MNMLEEQMETQQNLAANAKRKVDLVVISDVHLGTYGCHAVELLRYLESIDPAEVILNGDIIDIWQFSKRYWPDSHMMVLKHLLGWVAQGIPVHYLTGNHDELLRRFAGFRMGSFQIANKLVKTLDNGEKAWFFHGDVFDVTMKHSKWLAQLGGRGYDLLILLNRAVNYLLEKMGRGKFSLSKKIKNSVKGAVSYISNFEVTAAEMAIFHGYDFVVCGHIHQPEMRLVSTTNGQVQYLNSGDWIENLSALEYSNGKWELFFFEAAEELQAPSQTPPPAQVSNKAIFEQMWKEFQLPLPMLS
jgi:UDP-2,3-diacylglucosamine pyrophosphatase LpxH